MERLKPKIIFSQKPPGRAESKNFVHCPIQKPFVKVNQISGKQYDRLTFFPILIGRSKLVPVGSLEPPSHEFDFQTVGVAVTGAGTAVGGAGVGVQRAGLREPLLPWIRGVGVSVGTGEGEIASVAPGLG
jgi:hypothetical protein